MPPLPLLEAVVPDGTHQVEPALPEVGGNLNHYHQYYHQFRQSLRISDGSLELTKAPQKTWNA